MIEWISAKERKPPDPSNVLAQGYNYDDESKGFWIFPIIAQYVNGKFHPVDDEDGVDEGKDLWARFWIALPENPE